MNIHQARSLRNALNEAIYQAEERESDHVDLTSALKAQDDVARAALQDAIDEAAKK